MMRIRVSISSAMLLSFVLHVLLLIAIEPDFEASASQAPVLHQRGSVVFTLLPHLAPPNKVRLTEEPLVLAERPTKASIEPPIRAADLSAAQMAKPKKIFPIAKKLAKDASVVAEASRRSMISTREVKAFENFTSPKCDVLQRASLAKPCVSDALALMGEHPQLLGGLFRDLSSTSPNFERNMDSVDRLLAQAETLQVLVSSDPAQRAVAEEQQRHIRQEILRIDRAHQQVNLLKLIPQVARIVRGINDSYPSAK